MLEKYRFKNVVISGRFCREDSNLGPSKNSSHRTHPAHASRTARAALGCGRRRRPWRRLGCGAAWLLLTALASSPLGPQRTNNRLRQPPSHAHRSP